MIRTVARFALAVLTVGLPAPAPAQVAISLGAGVVYGPMTVYGAYAPAVVAPYPLYRYGGAYPPAAVVPYPLYGYGGAGFVYPPPRSDGPLRCFLRDSLPTCSRCDRVIAAASALETVVRR